jgi:hypothetical protein
MIETANEPKRCDFPQRFGSFFAVIFSCQHALAGGFRRSLALEFPMAIYNYRSTSDEVRRPKSTVK